MSTYPKKTHTDSHTHTLTFTDIGPERHSEEDREEHWDIENIQTDRQTDRHRLSHRHTHTPTHRTRQTIILTPIDRVQQ